MKIKNLKFEISNNLDIVCYDRYAAGPYSQQAMTPYQPYNLMQQVDPRMAQTQLKTIN